MRIWWYIKKYSLTDYSLHSRYLFTGQCLKIVRRIYILIILGSQRANYYNY